MFGHILFSDAFERLQSESWGLLLELMPFDIARKKEKKLKFFGIFVNDL